MKQLDSPNNKILAYEGHFGGSVGCVSAFGSGHDYGVPGSGSMLDSLHLPLPLPLCLAHGRSLFLSNK